MTLPLPVAVGLWILLGLVLLTLIVIGWRHRVAAGQMVLTSLPQAPGQWAAAPVESFEGTYVTTTVAGDWLARFNGFGLGNRATAELNLFPNGLQLYRHGEETLNLPAPTLTAVGVTSGMVGKVVAKRDLVVISWKWEEHNFETGFLPRHRKETPIVLAKIESLVPPVKETS